MNTTFPTESAIINYNLIQQDKMDTKNLTTGTRNEGIINYATRTRKYQLFNFCI